MQGQYNSGRGETFIYHLEEVFFKIWVLNGEQFCIDWKWREKILWNLWKSIILERNDIRNCYFQGLCIFNQQLVTSLSLRVMSLIAAVCLAAACPSISTSTSFFIRCSRSLWRSGLNTICKTLNHYTIDKCVHSKTYQDSLSLFP